MSVMQPRISLVDSNGNEKLMRMPVDTVMPASVVGVGVYEDGTPILYLLIPDNPAHITDRDEWVPGARRP